MPTSKNELDRFYEYASGRLDSGEGSPTLEGTLHEWRTRQQLTKPSIGGYPDGQTLADRLITTGLLGALLTLPTDLSTNPEHMNGFGES